MYIPVYKENKQQILYDEDKWRGGVHDAGEMDKTPQESLATMTVHQSLGCHNTVYAGLYPATVVFVPKYIYIHYISM